MGEDDSDEEEGDSDEDEDSDEEEEELSEELVKESKLFYSCLGCLSLLHVAFAVLLIKFVSRDCFSS